MTSVLPARPWYALRPLLVFAVLVGLAAAPAALRAQSPARPAAAAPAPAPAAPATTDGPAPSASYVISPNDAVQVDVYQEDDMRTAAVISKEGTINLPLIGAVKISGLTQAQARDIITEKLRPDYYKNPQVSVTVVRFARKRFTILGQVNRPGSFDMPDQESIDLLEAVAMAGGYTRIADAGRITVRRHVGANDKIFKVDAKKMAKDTNVERFNVQPGDSITVAEGIF